MLNPELEAVIEAAPNKQISRRLRAISSLLSGMPLDEVSIKSGSGTLVILKWKRLFDEGGVKLLLESYPEPTIDPKVHKENGDDNTVRLLATLALETDDRVYQKRLKVVSELLAGKTGSWVAKKYDIPTSTATSWLQFYRKSGLDGLKPRTGARRRQSTDIRLSEDDRFKRIQELRAEIDSASDKHARRLTAVAVYLETLSWQDAQRASHAGRTVVGRWVQQYTEEGLIGLQDRFSRNHLKRN
jgi:transposase